MRRALAIALILGTLATLACAAVIIASQYQRADRAEARADRAETKYSDTKADLFLAEQKLDATDSQLDDVETQMADISRSVDRAKAANDKLTARDTACRYVVKVSDELLGMSIAYGKASGHFMAGRNGHGGDLMDRAVDHTDRIDALVKQAGYETISQLYGACTPGATGSFGPVQ